MSKKIYALTTLERYGVELDVRLFDTIKQCRKEYDAFIKQHEEDKTYVVSKGVKHTEIKYDDDELPTIFASIQTHQLNDVQRLVFRHPFYCVIYANQDGYYKNNENFYLFHDEEKASKQFYDILNTLKEKGVAKQFDIDFCIKEDIEYWTFEKNKNNWGHIRTEKLFIKSEVK